MMIGLMMMMTDDDAEEGKESQKSKKTKITTAIRVRMLPILWSDRIQNALNLRYVTGSEMRSFYEQDTGTSRT